MALSYVPINSNLPMGYGVDFRVNRSQLAEAAGDILYCRKTTINNASEEPIDDTISAGYYYPTGPVNCEIVSTNAADTQTITIYYYPDSAATLPSIQQVTLTGTTPVVVPSAVFRGRRMTVTSVAGLNQGSVTMYETGTPANIISAISPNMGFSMDSYIYIPANTTGILIKCEVLTNAESVWKLQAYRYLSVAVPTYKLKVQEYSVSSNISLDLNCQPPLPANTTYELTCSGLGTADATVAYEFLFMK